MRDGDTDQPVLGLADIEDLGQRLAGALTAPSVSHGLARALRAALKELDLYRNHLRGQATAANTALGVRCSRVQIGGGRHRLNGFLNIDIVPPADVLWDVREGMPLPDDSVELLFSEHFLEHIDYPASAGRYVAEAHRVLQFGGQVVTGVPDAELVLRGYSDRDSDLFSEMREQWYGRRDCVANLRTYLDLVNYVFRDQDDSARYAPHLWAYDYENLASLFSDAGFRRVERWAVDPMIVNPDRVWGSLYVVATK